MKKQWQKLTDGLIGSSKYFLIDASVYSFYKIAKCYIRKYARKDILDAGAGRLAFKYILAEHSVKYYSIDKYVSRRNLDIVGDLARLPIKRQFDTVTCFQVIEHTTDPEEAIKNLANILKDDGMLILSAPHFSYLHGEPEDYYRFTKHGLFHLLGKSGLEIIEISPAGSIFGFLSTPVSDFILSYVYGIPLIFPFIFFINSLFVRLVSKIDSLFFRNSLMPVNYVLSARKANNKNEQ